MAVKIFYGGGVNIGRHMHGSKRNPFEKIPAMTDADLRIVNLVSVVEDNSNNLRSDYLYARPEQINLLTDARVDVVINANRQAFEDGDETFLAQNRLLDKAGIIHVDARPVLVRIADQTVAILPVNVADKNFAADASKSIADLRAQADTIFVTANWAFNAGRVFDRTRELGQTLIDCGADAVPGNHPAIITYVDQYKNRPIIYGAGILLHDDRGERDSGCYSLTVDRDGVKRVEFTALRRRECYTVPATLSKERLDKNVLKNAKKLGTNAELTADGSIEIEFDPAPRGGERLSVFQYADANSEALTPIDVTLINHTPIEPLTEPLPEWTVERVP